MKYKLFNDKNKCLGSGIELIKYALRNRGVNDVDKYVKLKEEDCVCHYSNLNNIKEAVEMFNRHIENKSPTIIIVDPDVDGYTSAAIVYQTIKTIDVDYPVSYIIHSLAKAHGLTEDIVIPEDTKFLIIPDAGTNDTVRCKELKEKGIDILILDHHQRDESIEENKYACIVNNQLSEDYWNKDFCGAGIVYKFLQALDDENWTEYADNYLDLVALANISDNMDIRSLETKYYINLGLKNIKNECFKGFIKAQEFRIKNHVNIHNIQWYITPLINGLIRVDTLENKQLLFKAFIEEYDEFEYKKRATKNKPSETIIETIYEKIPRLCSNAKGRQDRKKEKGIKEICKVVDDSLFDDKVIIRDVTDIIDRSLCGLAAIKIADIYNRPCILLKRFFNKDLNREVYGGSARNVNYSPIENLRELINDSNEFNFATGHDNAFGVEIEIDKLDEAINKLNDMLKSVEYDSTYKVDFIFDYSDVGIDTVNSLSEFSDYVGTKVDELFIAVKNISLSKNDFIILGKNDDTIKFQINGVDYIMFGCKSGNPLYDFLEYAWGDDDEIEFEIVGRPSISEYQGLLTPQIEIKDINVIQSSETNNLWEDEEW